MKTLRTLLLLLVVSIGYDAVAQNLPQIPANRGQGRRIIPGKFIITVADGTDPLAVAREHGMVPEHVYSKVLNGMAGSMSDAARSGMLGDRRVLRVEQDVAVTAEQSASWNLDRIDQRRLPLSGTYARNYTGLGVTVYVIDAGIRYDHVEFGGRASFGYDVFGGNGSDCNGHGTHVAGTIGGSTYGVANRVSLVSVRVLDCNGSGSMSGVIAGMDWVAGHRHLPAVANLSVGGSFVQAVNDAVTRLTNYGVVVVVAAGNENTNACNSSPASAPDAITVAATDQSDVRASFSNYGSCVDFFAPGVTIPSAYNSASNAYVYMSGTSMASPHVAGAAALILQHNTTIAPRSLRDLLYSYTSKGIVTSAQSSNNHLLYSLEQTEGTTTPSNSAPTANFTQSCTNLACTFTDLSTDADGTIASWLWNFGNGVTSTAKNPSYSYPSAGTYSVSLRVTDNAGASSTTSKSVSVSAPATSNYAPTASFTSSCSSLSCGFTDQSTDADGYITAWSWNFGNGVTSTVRNPSYSYPASGTYTVTLTVTDNAGAKSSTSRTVTVSSTTTAQITLTLRGYTVYGYEYVEIRWSGATGQYVDIYMNGSRIGTVSNSGAVTHRTNLTGPRTLTYKVCNYGTSVCSASQSVTFY